VFASQRDRFADWDFAAVEHRDVFFGFAGLKREIKEKPLFSTEFNGDMMAGNGWNSRKNMVGQRAVASQNVPILAIERIRSHDQQ
jgi:hypothetical protein